MRRAILWCSLVPAVLCIAGMAQPIDETTEPNETRRWNRVVGRASSAIAAPGAEPEYPDGDTKSDDEIFADGFETGDTSMWIGINEQPPECESTFLLPTDIVPPRARK